MCEPGHQVEFQITAQSRGRAQISLRRRQVEALQVDRPTIHKDLEGPQVVGRLPGRRQGQAQVGERLLLPTHLGQHHSPLGQREGGLWLTQEADRSPDFAQGVPELAVLALRRGQGHPGSALDRSVPGSDPPPDRLTKVRGGGLQITAVRGGQPMRPSGDRPGIQIVCLLRAGAGAVGQRHRPPGVDVGDPQRLLRFLHRRGHDVQRGLSLRSGQCGCSCWLCPVFGRMEVSGRALRALSTEGRARRSPAGCGGRHHRSRNGWSSWV